MLKPRIVEEECRTSSLDEELDEELDEDLGGLDLTLPTTADTLRTIHVDRISTNVEEILSGCDDVVPVDSPEEADLLWLRHGYRSMYDRLGRYQLFNHIPGEGNMTRKGDIADVLHSWGAAHPDESFSYKDFYKETYRLFDREERSAFLTQLPEEDTEDNLWIMKPSALSRGIGVKVKWKLDELKEQLRDTSKMTLPHDGEEMEYVIQRYMKDVLLLRGRKSELRVYWAILSIDPLRVVMYPEGTVRITMQDFQLGDYDNPLIHLANVYQQKQHPDYDPKMELKWSFSMLEDYVQNELGLCNPGWVEGTLKPRLKRCLAYVANAIKARLLEQKRESGLCFGFYGADVMLDRQLNPWITEIQKGPGLSYSDSIKGGLIPPMLKELAHLAFELRERTMSGDNNASTSDEPFQSLDRFEWVVSPCSALTEAEPARAQAA